MVVYLSANKKSEKTTVTVEDVREFVEEVAEVDASIKRARAELKDAIEEDEKIEEFKESIKRTREALKSYVEGHTVYKEYQTKIDTLKEDKRDIVSNAKTKGIPKKEIDTAIRMLKSDIDPDSTTEIYSNIADLID